MLIDQIKNNSNQIRYHHRRDQNHSLNEISPQKEEKEKSNIQSVARYELPRRPHLAVLHRTMKKVKVILFIFILFYHMVRKKTGIKI